MARQHEVVRRGGRKLFGLGLVAVALFFVITEPAASAEHVLTAVHAITTFVRSL